MPAASAGRVRGLAATSPACGGRCASGQPTWVVSRYQDIRAALVDPRLSAETIPDSIDADGRRRREPGDVRADRRSRASPVAAHDDQPTSPSGVAEAMRPQIQEMVDQYLGEMIDNGPPADLVRDFALPVPSLVIALLLGVPPEDLELFQHNTSDRTRQNSTDEERAQAFGAMYVYIQELVARKAARTRRRLDQPSRHRLRRDRPTRP